MTGLNSQEFRDALYGPRQRSITLYTCAGGFDLFNIAYEESAGFFRIYMGKKIPRIARRVPGRIIHKDYRNRFYYLSRKKPFAEKIPNIC